MSIARALEAHERLSSVGIDASAPDSPNMKLLLCTRTNDQDVVVCVRHTGATKEVIRYGEITKKRGSTLNVLTSYAETRLARLADIQLVAGGREHNFRFDAMSARITHLALLDAIYIYLPQILRNRATDCLATFHVEEAAWHV